MNWPDKTRHFILLILFLGAHFGFAVQASVQLENSSPLDLSLSTEIYNDQSMSILVDQVGIMDFVKLNEQNRLLSRNQIYWLKINLPLESTFPAYLSIGRADDQTLYIPTGALSFTEMKTGYMVSARKRSMRDHRSMFKIEEPFDLSKPLYVKLKPKFYRAGTIVPSYYSSKTFDRLERDELKQDTFYNLYNAFILGIFLIMMLYGIFSFWVTKDKVYLWYGMYLLLLGLYFALKFDNQLYYWNPELQMRLFDPIPLLSYYFYYRFVRSFLDLKKLLPKWDNILKYMGWLVVAYAVFDLVFMQIAPNAEMRSKMYTIIRLMIILVSIIIIVRFYFTKSNLVHFINTGSMLLLIGATITMIKNPLYYMQAGVALEILFFSLGLAYRNRLNEEAKLEAQQLLILEEQKEIQLKKDFETKLAKVEMSSLRAQMNPHFIFNSLNSIKSYIVKNNAVQASDYLSKFSKLMRLILQNSSSNRVSLARELEALKLYIELEAMRFNGKFDFTFNVQEDIELEFVKIPAMLIQPYVENAIWHGLMHKANHGQLVIEVSQVNKTLTFVVQDNGVGRKHAAQIEKKPATQRKSMGMEITRDRIRMMNQLYGTNANVHIEDLENDRGDALGTRVTITIEGKKM